MKKITIKSFLYLGSLSVVVGCGGGGGDPIIVAEGPSVGEVIIPPVMPPAPPPPPTTMPPISSPVPPPVTGPINVPGAPVPLPPAPAPPPATGSSSTDYSWLYGEGSGSETVKNSIQDEAIMVAKLDIKEITTSQAQEVPTPINSISSLEERKKQIEQEMEAERIAMEQYHKKQMDELMAIEIKMKAIQNKLQENVNMNWLGVNDGLTVLSFDKLNPPGEEALPCDYSHMAFVKHETKGMVNVGEIIDWGQVSKPENNYKGWFFVVSPFVFNDDMQYFKGVEGETHLLWARRISEKELAVKPAGSPWATSEQFKTENGYKNIRVSYDGVALPVLALDNLLVKHLERVQSDVMCPVSLPK